MEINCGSSVAAWGMKNAAEEDFLHGMSFSGYQMLYDTVNWVANGDGSIDVFTTSLPEDPFCMNIRSTLNSISDWFYENHLDFVSDEPIHSSDELSLPEDPFCMKVRSTLNTFSDWFNENQRVLQKLNSFPIPQLQMGSTDFAHAGQPHDAFEFVLPYLDTKGILAVEGVCRSLRDSVRKEPFFWRTSDLSHSPLKYRLTDDSLFKLTRHAQGDLHCLNLGGCVGITDNGLMQVLANNPCLTKLSISGCLRLSTAGVLSIFRDLKSSNLLGVKSLITGGVLYFTKEQFEELNLLLGADANTAPKSNRQRFYTYARSDFSLEDGRVTDLELCPWCDKPSLVFDCPAETCPLKNHSCRKLSCRACVVCIERCHDCGGCLSDCQHKPFWFAFSCVVCYKKRANQLQELV